MSGSDFVENPDVAIHLTRNCFGFCQIVIEKQNNQYEKNVFAKA
jgi:hypothetical protein